MRGDKTVLVVEDDKLLGKSLQEYLSDAGYNVIWAREGGEAYQALDENSIDLILLDIMLPGEDGYHILKHLKGRNSDEKDVAVVMLTNLGQISEMDRALELGASDYVIKSNTDLDKIVQMVHDKLEVIAAHKNSAKK